MRIVTLLVAIGLLAVACSNGTPAPAGRAGTDAGPPPGLDQERIAAGEALYGRFCASCHGSDLRGAPDWKVPNADGSYPPPPQDSSGHTWHHGDTLLVEIILEGSDFPQTRMPTFGDRLNQEEALSILEYFKSTWGPEERARQWAATVGEASR